MGANQEVQELSDSVKAIMSTQLSETEVLVYLLMEGGYSAFTVADLPLGITKSTADRYYKSAKSKMEKMQNAGIFSTEVKHGV